MSGKGKYVYGSGKVYEGEYLKGKKHGYGKLIETNGKEYEGNWKKGNKHGKGFFT